MKCPKCKRQFKIAKTIEGIPKGQASIREHAVCLQMENKKLQRVIDHLNVIIKAQDKKIIKAHSFGQR